jgi:hypothetical protein
MLDVLMLFPKSGDAGSLDEPIARIVAVIKENAALRSLRVSEGDLMARGGPPPWARVIEASFDSLADWMATVDSLNRPQADLADAVRVDPTVVFFEAREQ